MKPKWIRCKGDKPIYTGKCYGFEIKTQDYKGYQKPFSMLYGQYNLSKTRYKIMVYMEQSMTGER